MKKSPAPKEKQELAPAPKREKRLGRKPDAFSEVDVHNLETLIGAGNSTKASCEALGLPEREFYHWIDKSQEANPNPKYVDFERRMRMAKGLNKVNSVKVITEHASKGDWRAAAWLLERQFPDEFAERGKVAVDVAVKGSVQHEHQHKVVHVHIPAAISQPRLKRISPNDPL